jgi:hypothetical protein
MLWAWVASLFVALFAAGLIADERTEVLLTNQRIVQANGLFRRHCTEWSLDAIVGLKCQRSPLGRMRNCGSIVLASRPDKPLYWYSSSPLGKLLGYGTLGIGYTDGLDSSLAMFSIYNPLQLYIDIVDACERRFTHTGKPDQPIARP